jgi:hypothetical protein
MEQELTSKNRSLTLLGTVQYLSEGMDRYKLGRDIDFFLQIILVGSILFDEVVYDRCWPTFVMDAVA